MPTFRRLSHKGSLCGRSRGRAPNDAHGGRPSSGKAFDTAVVLGVPGVPEDGLDHLLASSEEPLAELRRKHVSHPRGAAARPAQPWSASVAGVRGDQRVDVLVRDDLVD